jgi:heat shock protein HtpX
MYEQIRRNRRASWLLMGMVVALLAALGYAIGAAWVGGTSGGLGLLGVFGVVAIAWSVIGYYTGDRLVLAVSGAHQVTHDEAPQLYNVVEEMTIAAGLPQVPAVYIIEDPAPNAFATGRDPKHASVAVTSGLLGMMDREELQGVVAHELSHVRNYDIRFATLVGILVGMIALVADFFLRWSFFSGMGGRGRRSSGSGGDSNAIFMVVAIALAILAPLAAYAVQFAISRKREYLADATGVQLTRNPLGLARALNVIAGDPDSLRTANRATAHLYIANPLRGKKAKETAGLFDTHPPIQERIAILLAMAHAGPEALTAGPRPADAATADAQQAGRAVPPPAASPGLPGMPGLPPILPPSGGAQAAPSPASQAPTPPAPPPPPAPPSAN